MLVIDSMWFNSLRGHFGFVLAEDTITGKRSIYAGVVDGRDQKADEQAILRWGGRVNIPMMKEMLSKCKPQVKEDENATA